MGWDLGSKIFQEIITVDFAKPVANLTQKTLLTPKRKYIADLPLTFASAQARSKSDNITAHSFAYINAQLFEPRLFFLHQKNAWKRVFIILHLCEHIINRNISRALLHLSETGKIQLCRHNTKYAYTSLKNTPLPTMST